MNEQQSSVKNVFIRGSVVRYVHLPGAAVDTALLEDATRRGTWGFLWRWKSADNRFRGIATGIKGQVRPDQETMRKDMFGEEERPVRVPNCVLSSICPNFRHTHSSVSEIENIDAFPLAHLRARAEQFRPWRSHLT